MNINKQALLEWLKADDSFDPEDIKWGLMQEIQSGRFDDPVGSDIYQKAEEYETAYVAAEQDLKLAREEIDRLRAALERIIC